MQPIVYTCETTDRNSNTYASLILIADTNAEPVTDLCRPDDRLHIPEHGPERGMATAHPRHGRRRCRRRTGARTLFRHVRVHQERNATAGAATQAIRHKYVGRFACALSNCTTTLHDYSHAFAAASAVTATLIHDAISNPTEVIKQRLQMYNSPYKSIVQCARGVYATEGLRAFYRSYNTQLIMNLPYQSIHLVTYEFIQNLVSIESISLSGQTGNKGNIVHS